MLPLRGWSLLRVGPRRCPTTGGVGVRSDRHFVIDDREIPKRDKAVESHVSQKRRDMGHPAFSGRRDNS
jgi:hypothetical protein